MPKPTRSCSIAGCDKPNFAYGVCQMHSERWKARGSYDNPYDNATLPGEVWKPIPGYVGLYEASDHGRVRVLPRQARTLGNGVQTRPGRIMHPKLGRGGYFELILTKDGEKRYTHVHRVVCEAFHGVPEQGKVVRHLDGTRTKNVPSNLVWGTYVENADDSVVIHKTHKGTQQTHCIRGHSLDENAYVPPKRPRQRYCRECMKLRKRGLI